MTNEAKTKPLQLFVGLFTPVMVTQHLQHEGNVGPLKGAHTTKNYLICAKQSSLHNYAEWKHTSTFNCVLISGSLFLMENSEFFTKTTWKGSNLFNEWITYNLKRVDSSRVTTVKAAQVFNLFIFVVAQISFYSFVQSPLQVFWLFMFYNIYVVS